MQKPWSINRVEFQTFFLSEKNRFFFFPCAFRAFASLCS